MIIDRNATPSNLNKHKISNVSTRIQIFLVLFLTLYTVHLFGNFFISEFIFLFIFLRGLLKGELRSAAKLVKPFIGLLVLAIFGEIIADLWNGSSVISSFKGFSLILFTLINLLAIIILTKFDPVNIHIAIFGFAASGLASFFVQPGTYARSEIWKFGIGYPLILMVFCLLSLRKIRLKKLVIVSLIIFSSGLSLFLGARSLALVTFLAVFFVRNEVKVKKAKFSYSVIMIFLLLGAIGLYSSFYFSLAKNGTLGDKAQAKYILQTATSDNIIINSRTELLFAGRAVIESPILGFGSYAELNQNLRTIILTFLTKNNIYPDLAPFNRTYGTTIPVHSMILQWWLWFGIFGLLFPLKLLVNFIRAINIIGEPVLYYYLIIGGVWNVLFSPYGESCRILIPLTIIAVSSSRETLLPKE